MDSDPIVGARVWDLQHDCGFGGPPVVPMREASVVFPVAFQDLRADYAAHMYADEPAYVAFAREVMGWPVRSGRVAVSARGTLEPGAHVTGTLEREGAPLMQIAITLTEPLDHSARVGIRPHWITEKWIPSVDGPGPAVGQIVHTFAESVDWGPVWAADAEIGFYEARRDELAFLRPREIVRAEYWSAIALVVGYGRILAHAAHSHEDRPV